MREQPAGVRGHVVLHTLVVRHVDVGRDVQRDVVWFTGSRTEHQGTRGTCRGSTAIYFTLFLHTAVVTGRILFKESTLLSVLLWTFTLVFGFYLAFLHEYIFFLKKKKPGQCVNKLISPGKILEIGTALDTTATDE